MVISYRSLMFICWLGLLVCSTLIAVLAVLALILRKGKLWGLVRAFALCDLIVALALAVLDHLGYAR